MSIIQRLRGAPETAAQIAKAIDEAEAALPALRSAQESAVADRSRLLLEGDDQQVLAAERTSDLARIAVDRGEAKLAELRRRQREAVSREEVDRRAAARAAIESRAEKAAQRVKIEYARLAESMVSLLTELADAEGAISAFNRSANRDADGGLIPDFEPVAGVEARLFDYGRFGVGLKILEGTSIVPVGDGRGWGAAAEVTARQGVPLKFIA